MASLGLLLLTSAFVSHHQDGKEGYVRPTSTRARPINYYVDAMGNRIIKSAHKSPGCYYSVRVTAGVVTCQKINL